MFEIKVNGKWYKVSAFEDEPLLWVLRERLGFTSVKFGCGIGVCGACTVLLNHKAVRACSLSIKEANKKEILTIEGIPSHHPLKRAWIKYQVSQCGYCQPGQILEIYALLLENPSPSEKELTEKLNGHLCRCGTYVRIKKAVKEVVKELKAGGKK